jgi:hypothetical protein
MDGQWWFKSFGQEFGPLRFDDLVEAVHKGTLVANDLVRNDESSWRRADSVEGLFNAPAPEWLVEVTGQTLGPLTIVDVATMIRERKLLPTDRIRHVGTEDYQPIQAILDRSGASARSADTRAPCDDLESFILAVLGAPSENRSKPSLVELGLGKEESTLETSCDSVLLAPMDLALDQKSAPTSRPFNLFRRSTPMVEGSLKTVEADEEPSRRDEAEAAQILPPVERDFKEAQGSVEAPRHGPWLELLLLTGGVLLALQLFPAAGTAVVAAFDVRNWTWGRWVGVEIAAVVVLGGVAAWRRV